MNQIQFPSLSLALLLFLILEETGLYVVWIICWTKTDKKQVINMYKARQAADAGQNGRQQHNSQIQMLKNKKNNKDRNSKSRNKRILTVYSSQPSLLEPAPKGISLPLKKPTKHSIPHLSGKPHPKPKAKHTASTKHFKPTEIYERIPMNYMHSNTNSEIEFSNYGDTRHELQKPFRRPLFIDTDQQALMKEIWRVDKKKRGIEHDAAVKIQKVFRGYLTRKLLMKYVLQYEEKLLAEKRLLERKVSFKSKNEREQSNYSSSLRNSYFPSNKKSIGKSEEWGSAEKENPLDIESSILPADHDHFISLQEHQILSKPIIFERRGSQAERSSLTLNESSIQAQVQQISLSFGQDCQHSAHFIQPSKRREFGNESISSPDKSHDNIITQISNDKTRDAISQNISNCPSYSKANKNERENPSQFSSIMKEEVSESAIDHEGLHLERLRSTQKAKWEQVISFVNQQMKEGINQEKTKELMSTILSLSVKNREELNSNHIKIEDQALVTPTTVTNRQDETEQPFLQSEQLLAFKKKRWHKQDRQPDLQRVRKNENMPLVRKMKEDKSIFERTSNLKQYFLKTMNFQDQQIDKMMELREAVLRRKESNSLIELNHLLENNLLSQDEFLRRLSQMSQTFERQKEDIEQTKNQIYQGYKAQLQLLKFTVLDAKFLGYKLPFCRSMEIFPNHPHWRFDELMIDELNQLASRRSQNKNQADKRRSYQPQQLTTQQIDNILESKESEDENRQKFVASQSEEDSISFSYEETNIYKKCEPFSFDISSLSDNVANSPRSIRSTIPYNRFATVPINHGEDTKQEKKQNDFEVILQSEQQQNIQKSLKKETYEIEPSEDEEVLYKESDDNLTQQIVETYMNKLIWETVQDIYASNIIKSSFSIKNYKYCSLQIINKKEKIDFVQSVLQKLPQFDFFKERLNQKMYPNTKELLMSMREVNELETGEPEYFQIGQYEYILNQEICYSVIEDFMEVYKKNRIDIVNKAKSINCDSTSLEHLQKYGSDKLKKAINTASKIRSIKIDENEQLRQQILKIQLHLILDSWNEQLIKYRENKNGYSGIGLNELSLSLIDRTCRPMKASPQFNTMLMETKKNLEDNIVDGRLNEKLIKEYQECVSSNDSQWILYSQEALQFGFDLAKTVEVELIFELLEDLHLLNQKRAKFLPEISQYESQRSVKDSQEQSEEIYSSNGSLDGQDPMYLNEQQEMELQKKMSMLHNYNSDSEDSFYD